MTCDERKQQLGLMVDGEPGAVGQGGLFGHLEGCEECRSFFDGLLRLRGAVRHDRERLLREADGILPAGVPSPPPPGRAAARLASPRAGLSRAHGLAARLWRPLPVPAVLGLAALGLAIGIAIGAGVALRAGARPAPAPAAQSPEPVPAEPRVVYVCAMPAVDVEAPSLSRP